LLTAEHRLSQPLAASIGKLSDEPPSQSVSNEHHASSLPAAVQLSEIPASAVITGPPGPSKNWQVSSELSCPVEDCEERGR
jgi:hypothetical protein